MGTGSGPLVGEVVPDEAWRILSAEKSARLIDVRTFAEWQFVGVADIGALGQKPLFIEWSSFPSMSRNPAFEAEVEEAVGTDDPGPLLFICRSGARSLQAAMAVAGHYSGKGVAVRCLNVAEGFEGDLDASGHRGDHNGWKARGLAWRQS
ncbi:MAG: rhodanese-like domain-containing protein [Silicimonas sp.]|jgi:rhodanese-related sulfurtransferase|nr:rhodanese-like domain-containing protein [Silicimonas sp.]